MKNLSLDRIIRKFVPSTSRLSFNSFFKTLVNSADIFPFLASPEFRNLPPNHLRIRIGVGNRLFNNQAHFLMHARDFWVFIFSEGIANTQSNILDIGSGCGRWAHWLRDYNFRGRRFSGVYVGIDIDEEAIQWCKQNYDQERFRFHLSTHSSISYNKSSPSKSNYRIPEESSVFDLIMSNSLLTHTLEADLINYLHESYRLLKHGGSIMHSHFNLDYPPSTYGARHTFSHQIGNAYVESLKQPEAAVAYRSDFLFRVAKDAGFKTWEVVHDSTGKQIQPILLCKK